VVHQVNERDIWNACNFKAVRSIGLGGGLEMMDICERSAGGRLENANQFAGCTTKLVNSKTFRLTCRRLAVASDLAI
jgi:hypothetical protein